MGQPRGRVKGSKPVRLLAPVVLARIAHRATLPTAIHHIKRGGDRGCIPVVADQVRVRKRPAPTARPRGRGCAPCRPTRSPSLRYPARIVSSASPPPRPQNFSVPFSRRFSRLIVLSTPALLVGRPSFR